MNKHLKNLESWLKKNHLIAEAATLSKMAGHKEELLKQHPQYNAELTLAEEANIKPGFLKWVVGQLNNGEPIDEIISMIGEYNRFYRNLEKKDLYQYNSLGELRQAIESIDTKSQKRKQKRQDIEGAYEVIYDDENFKVIHPHNKEASCHFGQGTRWCVSATTSQNYFNSYSSNNVFLYFILTKHGKGESTDKIAYAFTKTKQSLKAAIFDAEDTQIQEHDVSEYLGEKFASIKNTIQEHLSKKENTNFRKIIAETTYEDYITNINSIESEQEKREIQMQFRSMMDIIDPGILIDLMSEGLVGDNYTMYVLKDSPRLTTEEMEKHADKILGLSSSTLFHFYSDARTPQKIIDRVAFSTYANSNDRNWKAHMADSARTPPEILIKLFEEEFANIEKNSSYYNTVMYSLAENINSPPKILNMMYGLEREKIRYHLARNKNLPEDLLLKLAQSKSEDVVASILENPRTTKEIVDMIIDLWDDGVNYNYVANMALKVRDRMENERKTKEFFAKNTPERQQFLDMFKDDDAIFNDLGIDVNELQY